MRIRPNNMPLRLCLWLTPVLAGTPAFAVDAGMPPTQYLPIEPPMHIVVSAQQQAQSAQLHATLAKYGLKCGNPACPICYPPLTAP